MKNARKWISVMLALALCLSLFSTMAVAEGDTYTYNFYVAQTPLTWNSHEADTVQFITRYTEIGLWNLALNETADGYEWIPEMAVGEPEDITAQYAGDEKWGVPADATEGYAWKITLNPDAKWEDGTPINADSYIYSVQQRLNPDMHNRNVSSLYAGLPVVNAEYYVKSKNGPEKTAVLDGDGNMVDTGDSPIYINFGVATSAFWGYSGAAYYAGSPELFVNEAGEDVIAKYGEDYVEVTDEVIADVNYALMTFYGETEVNPDAYLKMAFYDKSLPQVTWEDVGILKTGEYELTLVFYSPLTPYFLKYNAGNLGLVYEPLYEGGKQQSGDMIKTNYGTSMDTYMSFGPYKLTSFQADKEYRLTRNENWYGWTDGKHEGQFQTTDIVCSVVEDATTAEMLFMQGKLDEYKLSADDLEDYQGSDFIVYSPNTYLYYLNMNNDEEMLTTRQAAAGEGINKTILTNVTFRKGISLAMDRYEFVAMQGTGKALFGYLSDYYVYDVETGTSYRNSEAAQNALTTFYGVESVDEITGYDLDTARECLVKGYEEALAAGICTETDQFVFDYPTRGNESKYVKEVGFMQDAIDNAVAGTVLEGRITVNMVVTENFYGALDAGEYELCMNAWSSSASDPFGLMEIFVTDHYTPQSMLGFDGYTETLTINVNGEDVTHTYADWDEHLTYGDYAIADADTRNQILAAMELAMMQMYRDCPFWSGSEASLLSMKINYPTYDFVFEVAYGGIRFMTYNFTDAEWAAFCEENNNQLNYQ